MKSRVHETDIRHLYIGILSKTSEASLLSYQKNTVLCHSSRCLKLTPNFCGSDCSLPLPYGQPNMADLVCNRTKPRYPRMLFHDHRKRGLENIDNQIPVTINWTYV